MIDIKSMFKDALKPTSLTDVLQICAESLAKHGCDLHLAISLAHQTLDFAQFSTFRFSQQEFQCVMRGETKVSDLIQKRLDKLVSTFVKEASVIFRLSEEDQLRVKDSLSIWMGAFCDDPEFIKRTNDITSKIASILSGCYDDDDEDMD